MNPNDRYRTLKDTTLMSHARLAEIIGIGICSCVRWYSGKEQLPKHHQATIDRLLSEDVPVLSPNIDRKTREMFYLAKYALSKGQTPYRFTRVRKYQFHALKVGQYFDVPSEDRTKTMNTLTSCIAYWRKKRGGTYRQESVPGAVRVWRMS